MNNGDRWPWPTDWPLKKRRALGHSLMVFVPGIGSCMRCDMPWSFVQEHVTNYSKRRGCFPLCEYCWKMLAVPEARLPFYEMLFDEWRSIGSSVSEDVIEQIRKAVKEGK